MKLEGLSLIGFGRASASGRVGHGINPVTGASLAPSFHAATPPDVDRAVALAASAFTVLGRSPGAQRQALLRRIAQLMESAAIEIVERAHQETALPIARLQGELARTCLQLRLYGDEAASGDWVQARIDHGEPHRRPQPKPDVRSMLRPVGPVAVFGASNFPLAYSVAGGDTASALAAGCTVIVKAHLAHPGTSELVGLCLVEAVRAEGLPDGTFSLLFDTGFEVGAQLVRHPAIKAVGFTGSRQGGRALMDLAAARPEPIPVYAEMGSVNPVFLLPGALQERAAQLAEGLHASFTLGVGQFCTNPGLVFVPRGGAAESFLAKLAELVSATPPGVMLTRPICGNFHTGVERLARCAGVERRAGVPAGVSAAQTLAGATLLVTDAATFRATPALTQEVFGPVTVVVRCADATEMLRLARDLEGQLTASVHAAESDAAAAVELAAVLETKAGRLVWNGFPTGVEVCHAMVHGGPYPATSDGRSTSVGTHALSRFGRLTAWQNYPDAALPDELKEANPLGLWRRVDGQFQPG